MELFEYDQFENDAATEFEPQGKCVCYWFSMWQYNNNVLFHFRTYCTYVCILVIAGPNSLFPVPSAPPPGAVFLIDSQESLKWLDRVALRMCVLSESHQLQPLAGMPLVILALGEKFMNENSAEAQRVTEVANR